MTQHGWMSNSLWGFSWSFFFFKLLKTRKDVSLPDNVNFKKIWLNTEVRGRGMDQRATFLLPCPQRGFGLFSSSDHAAGCRVPHCSMDRGICAKIPSSGWREDAGQRTGHVPQGWASLILRTYVLFWTSKLCLWVIIIVQAHRIF